ncbi:hypothetical protein LSCM1_04812 [Leishmania martiniquensis]|uniref:Calponin-homology (CH) domain-containing protein n=1 Tax=Leishmania martiniquensis TaxID=1580590 RepID=A0A836HFN6_9TRYP|nr:hypothetical protein LSCM1_04812 [Leishmania martiniquensis]
MPSIGASRQAPKVPVTPRAMKFSVIRKLPASEQSASLAAAGPANSYESRRMTPANFDSDPTFDTVRSLQEAQRHVSDEDATDRQIRRYQYLQFVARLNAQRGLYQSTAVFVETMLKEANHSAEACVAIKAAAATWGLKLVAKQAGHSVLNTILELLLPAVYCDYSPEKLYRAPPIVQLQVREEATVINNPYFTHSMFVDEVHVDKKSTTQLQKSLEAAVRANDERVSMACRLIERQRQQQLKVAFRSWRHCMRQRRLVRTMVASSSKRWKEEMSRLRAQAVFYHWRLLVERSRSTYLTERLHDAAFQLENAKSQFQLQCYRADRLEQTAREATEKMERVMQTNEGLQRQLDELKEEQVRKEREYNEKLTRNVTHLLTLLGTYDSLASVLLHSKETAESFMPEKPSSPGPFQHGDGSEGGVSTHEGQSLPMNDVSELSWESTSNSALQLLRQWCDGVLAQVRGRGAPFRPIRAFGADFSDGERYLYIFQYVFPEVISTVLSIHDMGVESRFRRICCYIAECGLRYRLVPSDFLNKREDLLVCSLSELYQKHMLRHWEQMVSQSASELDTFREGAMKAALLGFTAPLPKEEVADVPTEQLDEAAVRARMDDYIERVKAISERFSTALAVENELVKVSGAIAEQEKRLGGERLQGAPIPLVEEAERRAFWELPAGALDDLREAPQLSSEVKMWDLIVTQTLPEVLQKHVDTTSRLFFFFAGENAKTLSEVAFWRFIEWSGVLTGWMEVPMDWIATQYDHVVTPQLDAALRAVARSQSEMSVQKLRQVAYQEMDIRSATPQQFVELLVRLAVASERGERGLVEGTRRLLQELQLPHKEMSPIARELHTPETQHVLCFFAEDLFRVYLFYVKRQESSRHTRDTSMATQSGGRFASQMSMAMFLTMLEDCRFLSDNSGWVAGSADTSADSTRPRFFISAAQVRKLVSSLERLCKGLMNGGLSFNLFVETLAVLAYHWCPDPLVPEPRRLAGFLSHMVQQLSARHINSTLLLGTVPSIKLEGHRNVDFSHEARRSAGAVA